MTVDNPAASSAAADADYDVPATLDWLASRPPPPSQAPLRVALQWPDALLGDALGVSEALRAGAAARGLAAEVRKSDWGLRRPTKGPGPCNWPGIRGGRPARQVPAVALLPPHAFFFFPTTAAASPPPPPSNPAHQQQPKQFFVVADSTFNPAALDEVTAIDHGQADVAVHYGPASLAPPSRLPARFVFGRRPARVDAAALAAAARSHAANLDAASVPALVLLLDQRLDHAADELEAALAAEGGGATESSGGPPVVVGRAPGTALEPGPRRPSTCPPAPDGSVVVCMAGLKWTLPPGAGGRAAACAYLWAAPERATDATDADADDDPWAASPALDALHLALAGAAGWASVATPPMEEGGGGGENPTPSPSSSPHPYTVSPGLPPTAPAAARRRYFLMHKARAATIVGILVTALGDPAVVAEADALRSAAVRAGKTPYTFVIGRPTPFKLANFPEVDAWVAVSDAGPGQLLGGGKDWLAPVVTPHEARLAWGVGVVGGGGGEGGGEEGGACDPLDGWDPSTYRFDEPGEATVEAPDAGAEGRQTEPADVAASVSGLELVTRGGRAVGETDGPGALSTVRTGADFLNSRRTWRGLETPEVGADAAPAAVVGRGRAGRAAGYEGEG
jgi:diphthamide biosynthesis protein 2